MKNEKYLMNEPNCGIFNIVIKVYLKELNNIENLLKIFLSEFIYIIKVLNFIVKKSYIKLSHF